MTVALSITLLAACSSGTTGSESTSPSPSTSATQCGETVEQIAASAKAEGDVNLIALPDTWANYAGILKSFRDAYGLAAPVADLDATSAEELTTAKDPTASNHPDALDIGSSFTEQAESENLLSPYKTTNWAEIPDNLKDPDGNWVGSYFGVMSFGSNEKVVKNAPKTWADLKKPEYKGQVTLSGDPRESGTAFASVAAAALANGGSYDDVMQGIAYFADLRRSGNLSITEVTEQGLESGSIPIALDWSYNFPAAAAKLEEAGTELAVHFPKDGLYGAYYAQAAVSNAAHPCGARLWLEHITGDVGALGYIEGGAIPARYAAMAKAGVITDEMKSELPSQGLIEKITFPSSAQNKAMNEQVAQNWGPMVADQ